MLKAIIRYFYYSLFFVTPLLMFSKTSELFEFNKILFIYVISAATLSILIIYSLLYRNNLFKKTKLDKWIILFILALVVSTIFSIDRHTSIYGYYGRFNGGLLSIFSYIALFYVFVSRQFGGDSKSMLEKLLKVSLVSSFIVVLWGLSGRLGYDLSCYIFTGSLSNACWSEQFRPAERMFSTLGQPNWLGAYLAINFFIGLYFLVKSLSKTKIAEKQSLISISLNLLKKNKVLFYAGYLLTCFSGVLFTRSRSALLAVLIGIVLYLVLLIWQVTRKSALIKHLVAILLISVFVPILLFKTGISQVDKYLSITNIENKNANVNIKSHEVDTVGQAVNPDDVTESGDIRKIVWKGALDLGLKYPLFGTGVETFAYSYYFVRPVEHNFTSEWDFLYNKAHNEYLNYFATTGFIGLISYLLMIGAVSYIFILNIKNQISKIQSKNQKDIDNEVPLLLISLFVAYVTILITNFFGFSTSVINLFFYLIPAMLILIIQGDKRYANEDLKKASVVGYALSGVVLLVGILYFLSLINYLRADLRYALANGYDQTGEYQEAGPLYNEALNLRKEHVYQDKFSNVLANLAFIAFYNDQKDLSTKLIESSKSLNDSSIQSSPKNSLYWKTKGKNYYLFYQMTNSGVDLNSAIDALQTAEELSPTDPKIPYTNAVLYSLLFDHYSKLTTEEASDKRNRYKEQALTEVNKSLELKSNYQEAHLLKGQLLKKFGMFDEAKEVLNNALNQFDPADEQIKKELRGLE